MRHTKIFSAVLTSTIFGLMLPFAATPAMAQTPADSTRVAGVIAVVGDSIITSAFLVDATGRRAQELRQQGRPVPTTAEALKSMQEELINERIDELVILQTVIADTTYKVNEEKVAAVVEERYNQVQTQQGGPLVFAQRLRESGMTAQSYRGLLAAQARTDELFKQFRARIMQERKPPKATDKEIADLFPAWQQSRGPKPALVSFQQIVVRVPPADTALARAKAKADSIFTILVKDREQFADLARRFSDDTGSREKGGEFGWFTEDEVAKNFGRAAFSAAPGTLLPPVRTQFGFHIIEVQRRRGSQAQARHILISPTTTQTEIDQAKARADSAASRLRAGEDINELIRLYGDPTEDLVMTDIEPEKLLAGAGLDLTKATPGDIVGPAGSPPGPDQQFRIARVTAASPAGQWALNDPGVRDNLRSIVETQKLLNEVVGELKRNMYIEIRPH